MKIEQFHYDFELIVGNLTSITMMLCWWQILIGFCTDIELIIKKIWSEKYCVDFDGALSLGISSTPGLAGCPQFELLAIDADRASQSFWLPFKVNLEKKYLERMCHCWKYFQGCTTSMCVRDKFCLCVLFILPPVPCSCISFVPPWLFLQYELDNPWSGCGACLPQPCCDFFGLVGHLKLTC